MRNIKYIVLHCSAGPQTQTATDIVAYHLRSKAKGGRGWKAPGYHFIVEPDGTQSNIWPEEMIANGVYGYNAHSLHICYIGGVDRGRRPVDNRTAAQKATLRRIVTTLRKRYPAAKVCGHRDLSPDRDGDGRVTPSEWVKACPCFDAAKEYAGL